MEIGTAAALGLFASGLAVGIIGTGILIGHYLTRRDTIREEVTKEMSFATATLARAMKRIVQAEEEAVDEGAQAEAGKDRH